MVDSNSTRYITFLLYFPLVLLSSLPIYRFLVFDPSPNRSAIKSLNHEFKYAEWRKVKPRLDEGVDELIIHIEAMKGISDESLFVYKEVKEIKVRYKQQKDEIQAKIDALNKEKEKI